MQVKYRDHKESDLNFIFATLLKSYRYSNPQAKVIPKWEYYKNGSKEWAHCLANGGKIIVACADDDEDLIIAFAIYSDKALHYVYVKAAFRNAGIANQLYGKIYLDTPVPCKTYTHWTIDLGKVLFKDVGSYFYNPSLFKWFGYIETKGGRDERAIGSN